ncbi:Nif3-like dinuclear metal center hexameric protein [Sulfurimonas sp.]|uniref:Nif3-like dinuclear metal center hexameric protein n=1 Tax=Sulfurimonas sp. TaxID=2022749 RepID=UPI002AB1F788|nr:Nif3-like dinuclear metal center hexameric protein [Sulfurimonas sp.]
MKISQIYSFLDELSPFELQESWDNSGLLLGDFNQEVKKIVLSIDVDEELIDSMDNDTLLITHHPIIFGGLKQLEFNKYPANLIQKMIQKNISNIAMHTNFDITHLNDYVVKEILGYKISNKDGFITYFDVDIEFDEFAKKISSVFGLPHAKCVKGAKSLKKVALTTGSGCSLIKNVKADCFLTGDVKYHDAMEAKSINLSLIDIGHFESERFFSQILHPYLKNLGLEAIIASSKNPFTYI